MVAPIEFKHRVHLAEGIEPVRPRRQLPGFVAPVAMYWAACGALIHGVSTGSLRLDDWLATAMRLPAAVAEARAPRPSPRITTPSKPPPLRSRFGPPDLEAAPEAEPGAAATRSAFGAPPGAAALARATTASVALPAAVTPAPEHDATVSPEALPSPPPRPAPDPDGTAAPQPREDERIETGGPSPEPVERPLALAPWYPSCEAAIDAARQEIDLGAPGARDVPDLPRAAFARVLDHGGYLLGCGIPDGTSVDVCAAVQSGRVVGVTVATRPANPRMQRCVADGVQRLSFPSHPNLDVARTHFRAAP